MRPAKPDSAGGADSGADGVGPAEAGGDRAQGERTGEERAGRRGRRRRGERRGRDGRRPATEAGRGDSAGGRRGRRGERSTERRSSTGLARGRRDDFAPVAGGRDEDDEGLDFLGLEEAGHEGPTGHERVSAETEEVLAESGLGSVLDVPSWVEAIGIVIAGNLDARARSPRGDSGSRGGDRGRNDRRGGRPGDQG